MNPRTTSFNNHQQSGWGLEPGPSSPCGTDIESVTLDAGSCPRLYFLPLPPNLVNVRSFWTMVACNGSCVTSTACLSQSGLSVSNLILHSAVDLTGMINQSINRSPAG